MKKTYFILALALTLPVMAFAGDFHFVRKGKAVCQIVIPAKASKFEKMAAEDLSSFLKQMSGAAVRISTENKKMRLRQSTSDKPGKRRLSVSNLTVWVKRNIKLFLPEKILL
ncbi:MAG: hypothetical protein IKC05_09650 [Lentisphaeria bacterium]|nr:hypothetical protein [Lentisphaeria bacterium]